MVSNQSPKQSKFGFKTVYDLGGGQKLVTNLPITSQLQAIEKLHWYALRWKIEVFHKILKSGCKAEESKLRTAERLVILSLLFVFLVGEFFG